jgi:hypothetical protein
MIHTQLLQCMHTAVFKLSLAPSHANIRIIKGIGVSSKHRANIICLACSDLASRDGPNSTA